MDIRNELVNIFEDTRNWIRSDAELRQSANNSRENTILYSAEEFPDLPEYKPVNTTISVTGRKSFEAACALREQFPEAKIAVHNFASATNPGGGVTNGSRAQEESLCRCSTLYTCLTREDLWKDFYQFHRNRQDVRYTDSCIYSPNVLIIKSDTDFPERLPKENFCQVDILTCAAPNLRTKPYNIMNPGKGNALNLTEQELKDIHRSRARHLLTIAAAHEENILVLGAFGCGAFRNNPYVVAQAYQEILEENAFRNRFQHIEFAVYHTPRETENFTAFQKVFSK